ncbi:MAG: hypothetical protein NC907_03955 [Candidatus Omnitrophica bacterium]|nr:hypothetical protein [Candidatus Omnitrophota bacterium]MCM8788927.1 hypothetical protein [Candidatus Omnitrophota bacterium]
MKIKKHYREEKNPANTNLFQFSSSRKKKKKGIFGNLPHPLFAKEGRANFPRAWGRKNFQRDYRRQN